MSATNGGKGTPPVPPEGHGPPPTIQISKEITHYPERTDCSRTEDGGVISFIVLEGIQPVRHNYVVGTNGKKRILEELAGGITLP